MNQQKKKGKQQKPSDNANHQSDSSDLSISFDQDEFNRIYTNQLKKKQNAKQHQLEGTKQIIRRGSSPSNSSESSSRSRRSRKSAMQQQEPSERKRAPEIKREPTWHIYDKCDSFQTGPNRFRKYIVNLPVFKKKEEILSNIMNNQVVLITGQTGCGKSTQVPRLIYEYILATGIPAKIICVQPRRLAVRNLHKILTDQIPQRGAVGFQIAMQTQRTQRTKILFMTNGIFLQKLSHGTQFFEQFPFIVLDEVHQRDIDTDFILLSIKRLIRKYPKVRIILMSATIDNKLFQYYFAQDQIDTFMTRENYYTRFIRIEKQAMKQKEGDQRYEDQFRIQRVGEDEQFYKQMQMQYLKAKVPCPTVNVTEKGQYKKEYFYLDTLHKYMRKQSSMKWGSVSFFQKSPSTNKQIYETACNLLQQILYRSGKDKSDQSVLMFLPGLGQIQYMASQMQSYFNKKMQKFMVIKCHSSMMGDEETKKMHETYRDKIKVIIATNIAQSSITVIGVKHIIDFCLSKQINFNQKSRMENLQLVWASKASCEQRAGRTGRVCDGLVFRMVQKNFYNKLQQYSTPQIQRSSLDKLILRIKLIHEYQKNGTLFEDPGDVLGTAIQPPNLKNIDQSIKSLIVCGGLHIQNNKLMLTKLGHIYIDLPLDILYSKMIIFSVLMGTYEDVLILVCILSQNKNAFKKSLIDRYPLEYFQMMTNEERCDYIALIQAYKRQRQYLEKRKHDKYVAGKPVIPLDIYHETNLLIEDVSRRIKQKKIMKHVYKNQTQQQHLQKFKFTLAFGFLSNLIKVQPMIYDDRQQKRYKLMKKQNITVKNTIILLNSDSIRKSGNQSEEVDNELKKVWIRNISNSFRINQLGIDLTLGHGISFLHFNEQTDLNKFLFIKFMEKKRGRKDERDQGNIAQNTLNNILPHLGDVDYMQEGNTSQMFKDQKVLIDNFSSNRVIAINKQNQSYEFPKSKLVLTNSIIQQSSRLSCRFASLLPDIPNLQVILHLAFYPFISLLPDKKKTRFQYLYLKVRTKLRINYELSEEQISQANQIRLIIKDLMNLNLFLDDQVNFDNIQPVLVTQEGRIISDKNLDGIDIQELESPQLNSNQLNPNQTNKASQNKLDQSLMEIEKQNQIKKQSLSPQAIKNLARMQKIKKFWILLKQFILKDRKATIQQQKWQQLYYKQKQINQTLPNIKHEKQNEKQFMNEIKVFDLKFSYFSSSFPSQIPRQVRFKQYQDWKMQKYRQAIKLQNKGTDHDPYIICTQCNLKIAKYGKIGPINNQYFRQLFEIIQENVKAVPYNQMGDYFCTMIMTIYMEKEYSVYGCSNGHCLAVKFKDQKRLKILPFSCISVLYPDGTVQEQPEFQKMDFKNWRVTAQKAKIDKLKKIEENFCFVCNDKFKTIKQVEIHIKSQYHQANMRDFKATIPEFKRKQEEPKEFFSNSTNTYTY